MPVLIVYGMPESVSQSSFEALIFGLQHAAGQALNIPKAEVSVFIPKDMVKRGLGEELICIVEGLFEKPERTDSVRQDLAKAILSELGGFSVCVPQCKKIEVIVNRFDQLKDGFAVYDLN